MGVAAIGWVPKWDKQIVIDNRWLIGTSIFCFAISAFGYYHTLKAEPSTQKVKPKTYGIQIFSPESGDEMQPPIKMTGTIHKALPDNYELWVFSEGNDHGVPAFWPHQRVLVKSKKWTARYRPPAGYKRSSRYLRLYLVGPDGQTLLTNYRLINTRLARAANQHWCGITKLTSDILPVTDLIQVTLAQPQQTTTKRQQRKR